MAVLVAGVARAAEEKPHPLEEEIQAFEAADVKSPPPPHPILFVGSSSIVMWDLPKSFPGLSVLNRGFGGSRIGDSVYFFDRIVLKYQPRTIVFYAGDNDLAEGYMTPEAVLADFQEFVSKVRAVLPKTPIVFIAIKPSIDRWQLIDSIRKTNGLIKKFIESVPLVTYIALEPVMLGTNGKPRKELFLDDGLHLSTQGYKVWTTLVAPHLK
ncbi:MAG: SGNH/GDSL hydrolase family protein [Pirellulales bacterium]